LANLDSIQNFRPNLQILSLVSELSEFKGSWRSLSNISPERLARLKQIATIESIGSSTRIEGSSLSDEKIEELLSGLKSQSFNSRDEEEVGGYADAMVIVFENWQNIPITENQIKQLHGILLKHSHKDSRHRGNYKTVSNQVEAFDENGKSLGIVFKTASPFETPYKMTELVDWVNRTGEEKKIHPLIIVAVFVVAFLAIHPFQDGNGRLSRIITTLLLLKSGYTYVPYSSFESVIEASKEQYYLALRKTQQTLDSEAPDWEIWLLFFLRSMQKQKDRLQQKIDNARLIDGNVPALGIRILELLREQGSMQISTIEQATRESRSTLKLRINELVSRGKIQRHGRGRSTWYTLSNN
jgi:Fic family protein